MNDNMLNFVKDKLEENEGIAPEALSRLLATARSASKRQKPATGNWRPATSLLAASLAVAACGWFIHDNATARRESNLTNVIALLQAADDETAPEGGTLADALLSWQDAQASF